MLFLQLSVITSLMNTGMHDSFKTDLIIILKSHNVISVELCTQADL